MAHERPGQPAEIIHLGGLGGLLRDAVYRKAFAWLRECDRQMMAIRNETGEGAR